MYYSYLFREIALKLSIIIPAYNRLEPLFFTLESVRQALGDIRGAEVIIVDDGSEDPIKDSLKHFNDLPIKVIRQENQGLVFAKNRGLSEAKGEYIQFLDSDDLIHPSKLRIQLDRLEMEQADVCYCDEAQTILTGSYDELQIEKSRYLGLVKTSSELYFDLQPLPHNPLYRHSYLKHFLSNPIIKPDPFFNPVGELWMYYNMAPFRAKVVKVEGHFAICTKHSDEQLTTHWERLGFSALALQLLFDRVCPTDTTEGAMARAIAGSKSFIAWRRLPKKFSRLYEQQLLAVWRNAPGIELQRLGGTKFQSLARITGPFLAAKLIKMWQGVSYESIATISRQELSELEQKLREAFPVYS